MARLAVTVTALFFLLAISQARTSFDLPENEVNDRMPNIFPESDSKATILLPTEKTESDFGPVFEWEPKTTSTAAANTATDGKPLESDTKFGDAAEHLPESETESITSVPLTTVNILPINRHFQHMHAKRPFPFRFPHRCRHHFKPGSQRMSLFREVPYGHDMILSGENFRFDEAFGSGVHQIPATWVRFHHGKPRFPPGHHHHHHHHNEEFAGQDDRLPPFRRAEGEEKERGHEMREDGGFLKSFRKFLNHF